MALEREQVDLLPQGLPAPLPVPPNAEPATGPIKSLAAGKRHRRLWLPAVLLLALMLLGAAAYAVGALWLATAVTITIIPASTELNQRISIDATRGTPTPSQVGVLAYTANSPRQTTMHPASGTGHQPAVAGQGMLTFYNLATYQIVIPAGTVFTGGDGVQVALGATAFIPAGNPPALGSTAVSAYAVQPGAAGNIGPLDINTALGGSYNGVEVRNVDAFTGGQDGRTYAIVTRQDITNAAAPLQASLTQATQSALQGQLGPHERFLAQAFCVPSVQANPAAGQPGTQVTVTVQVACHRDAYNQQAATQLATARFTEQAGAQLGVSYVRVGPITSAPIQVSAAAAGHYTLTVPLAGRWVYQFDRTLRQDLALQLAGKASSAASSLLLHMPGIAQASIQLTGWNTGVLPTDTNRIHVIVAAPRSA
jgi:hypothetical protein